MNKKITKNVLKTFDLWFKIFYGFKFRAIHIMDCLVIFMILLWYTLMDGMKIPLRVKIGFWNCYINDVIMS